MKAIVIEQYGDRNQLKEKDVDFPVPNENQVIEIGRASCRERV